jgi:PTS system glucose-specific IIC component
LHTTFTAIGAWLSILLKCHIGVSFSCGLLDYVFYGVLPDINHAGANCWLVPIIGAAMLPLYFFIFTFSIKRYNLQTPGRGNVSKLFTKADFRKQQAEKILEKSGDGVATNVPQVTIGARKILLYPMVDKIIELYGGKSNITTVNACITKLRIDVKDVSIPLANKDELIDIALSTGSVAGSNVTPVGQQVQLLMGQIAGRVRDAVKEQLAKK